MVQLDSVNYTSSSEYSNRTRPITHLQIHHATTTSLSGLRALMAPGGRTVSANGAMGNDGHLMGVVPEDRRAFTSASSFDNNSYTIEVCNTSLAPSWGISDVCHWRLAKVAVDLHRQYGMPLDRAHIIGHNEVPGTYPTACPGPSMDLNRVVRYAYEVLAATAGGGSTPIPKEDEKMYAVHRTRTDAIYTFGKQYVKHETNLGRATFSKNAFMANDDWLHCNDEQISALCDSLNIPWAKVDEVTDSETSKVWSLDGDISAKLDELLKLGNPTE